MGNEFEIVSPESLGISSNQVEKCINSLMHNKAEIHGFMAARHGKVFTKCWWKPYAPDLVHSNHSLGKSYTATAIGILYTKGALYLEEKIIDIFADEMKEYNVKPYDKLERLTVRHVLKMATGMERNPMLNDDWIGEFLKQPIVYEPGEKFLYNTSGACLLGAIVEKRAGMSLHSYLKENLFEKIGINADDFVILKFKNGYCAEPGTFSKTEDNLRLAMLYLNYGKWDGEQIIAEDFMREALSVQIDTSDNLDGVIDCQKGYGFQLWACSIPGVFRFDGGQGQYGVIWPEKDMVVALHEGGLAPDGQQATLEVIYNELMLKMTDEALPENEQALESLRELENSLSIPEREANILKLSHSIFSGEYEIESGDEDANPWISVSPGNYNFFRAFFEKGKKEAFTDFTLDISDEKCVFIANGYAKFEAYFDGKFHPIYTDNTLPQIGNTASFAKYIDENTLEIETKWLNSWFNNVIRFEKRKDGKVYITTIKDRLHEGKNRYSIHNAVAVKK